MACKASYEMVRRGIDASLDLSHVGTNRDEMW
jgi:hypothetical protein